LGKSRQLGASLYSILSAVWGSAFVDTRSLHEGSVEQVPARIRPALAVLLEARMYAVQTGSNEWEFAVELEQLTDLGLTRNDFRWLVRKGFVEHQRDVTLDGDDGRAFRPNGDLSFPAGTCFILTRAGATIAANGHVPAPAAAAVKHPNNGSAVPALLPDWDAEARVLRLGDKTVKRFKWQAVNQEIVLSSFQEEGWPTRIDDPLPPQPDQSSKRRLSDTIKCLNHKQSNRLIHFRGDGTGEGIIWELVAPHETNGEQD
jgi:hypothetical protein